MTEPQARPARPPRTGVWLIGARGSVATTAIAGACAMRSGLASAAGCVTELPDFPNSGLPLLSELVFGGHDVLETPLAERAEELAHAGVLPSVLPAFLLKELTAVDKEIARGVGAGDPLHADAAGRLAADFTSFRERHALDTVVVVDVSSTEPPSAPHPAQASLAQLERALAEGEAVLPASSLYAYAAFRAGCPYVGFTPSTGPRLPALHELACERGVPYAGSDGKTGETLVKSVLAPLFALRALRVRSWSGTNLLGGGDGATLAAPAAAASKTASKERGLPDMLGYPVQGALHIDNVPEMGDWKTAWDHISFEGFLGVRMSLQFTWSGCDSALAAPLVLDLARLMAAAHLAGRQGPCPELAFFFKDPVGTAEHRLLPQYDMLREFAKDPGRQR